MASQKKLLILYYNFPPVKVPGAVRLHHFYKAALPWFEAIHVLTTRNRRFFLQDPSLETGCRHIIEVPAWDLRRLAMRKKAGNAPFVSSALKGRPLMGWFRRLLDSFPFNILIGDGGLVYILAGYFSASRLVRQQGITHVFSTFRPYSDHIIAHLLKRRFPGLFWIADFRDLHVDPVRKNVLWPAFQRWCNRRILRRADLVTTVSEGLKRHLEKLAPRVYVLRNGMGPLKEEDARTEPFEKFTVAYTGALYEGQRNPCPLFCAIRLLIEKKCLDPGKIALLYAGTGQEYWVQSARQSGVGHLATGLGTIGRQDALWLQSQAHLNLLLTWAQPGYQGVLTGKLFEYLQAGTPILSLVNGSRDTELEEILGYWKENAIFYSDDPEQAVQLEQFLLHHYRVWEGKEEKSAPPNRTYLKQYSWPHQMRRLIREL